MSWFVKFNGETVDNHTDPQEEFGMRATEDEAVRYALAVYDDALEFGNPQEVGGVKVYERHERGVRPVGRVVPDRAMPQGRTFRRWRES